MSISVPDPIQRRRAGSESLEGENKGFLFFGPRQKNIRADKPVIGE